MAAACGSDNTVRSSTDAPGGTTAPAATSAPGGTTAPAGTTAAGGTTAPAGSAAPAGSGPKVGLVYDIGGRGDQSFNDSARRRHREGQETSSASPSPRHRPTPMARTARNCSTSPQQSSDIVIAVGFLFEDDAAAVGKSNPDKTFGVVDSAMLDFTTDPTGDAVRPQHRRSGVLRGAGLVPRRCRSGAEEHDRSRSASSAASRASVADREVRGRLQRRCQGGQPRHQGRRRSTSPRLPTSRLQRSRPRRETSPPRCTTAAPTSCTRAAGGSGAGVFEAAKATERAKGTKVWAIGVDSDQYNTVRSRR